MQIRHKFRKVYKHKRFLLGFFLFILSFGIVSYTFAAWSPPTQDPPGGNVAAPVNVSVNPQTKEGSLSVGTLAGPNKELHVGGEVASTLDGTANFRMIRDSNPAVMHRNDGTNYHMLLTDNNDPWGPWNSLRPFRLNLTTGNVFLGSNTLAVEHNGNVGIGTTSPCSGFDGQNPNADCILEVSGDISARRYYNREHNDYLEIGPGPEFFRFVLNDEEKMRIESDGTVDFRNNNLSRANSIHFRNHEHDDFDTDGRLYWDLSAGLYIKSSNAPNPQTGGSLIWSSANVGAGSGINISYDGEDRPTLSVDEGSLSGDGYLPDDPATSNVNMNGNNISNVAYIGFSAGEEIFDGTNLRFDSNSGYIDFRPSDGSHGLIIRDFDGSGTNWSGIRTTDNGTMQLRADGSSYNHLTLTDAGRVGIGTSGPSFDLDVRGNIRSTSNIFLTGGNSYMQIPDANNVNHRFEEASDGTSGIVLRTTSNQNEIFQVRSSGQFVRFAVEHGAPTLRGNSAGWNVAGDLIIDDGDTGNALLQDNDLKFNRSNGRAYIWNRASGGDLGFYVNGSDLRFEILSNGVTNARGQLREQGTDVCKEDGEDCPSGSSDDSSVSENVTSNAVGCSSGDVFCDADCPAGSTVTGGGMDSGGQDYSSVVPRIDNNDVACGRTTSGTRWSCVAMCIY